MALDQQLSMQFRAMGADIAPEADTTRPQYEAFDVHPANWTSVRTWLRCETQWRFVTTVSGKMIRVGLDYASIDVVLRRLGLEHPDAVFADLMVMEDAALATLQEAQA